MPRKYDLKSISINNIPTTVHKIANKIQIVCPVHNPHHIRINKKKIKISIY